MARSRNIKPGFYKNEDLAECSLWTRLMFPGLWMLADREGRLEDRPKRIKGELFPYDNLEIEPCLDELEQWGFIERYVADGKKVIVILNFLEHQSPHGKEQDSELPDKDGSYTVHERTEKGLSIGKKKVFRERQSEAQGMHGASTRQARLIPDSLNLIPDCSPSENLCTEQKLDANSGNTKKHDAIIPGDVGSAKTAAKDADIVIEFPLNTKAMYPILRENYASWCELYPAVDVMCELRKMRGWLDANPKKRKTSSGVMKFVNGWLAK